MVISKIRPGGMYSGENNPLSEEQKSDMIREASQKYGEFLEALGYDWRNDPNMKETPFRVAKMFVNETTKGSYSEFPKITSFPNEGSYDGIVFQGNIAVKSLCSHHHAPFFGKAHVAYIPGEKVIGLSKINRIVDHYARRMQLQEQLTQQIHSALDVILVGNKGVAVFIEAEHTCVSMRGINDDSVMKTSKLSGYFFDNAIGTRQEFYSMVESGKRKH